MGLAVGSSGPEVPVERLGGPVPNPQLAGHSSLGLRQDEHELIEIDILDSKTGDFGQPRAGVDEDADNCGVPTLLEPRSSHARSSARSWSSSSTAGGLSGTLGRFHVPHRVLADFPLLNGEREETLKRPIPVGCCRRLPPPGPQRPREAGRELAYTRPHDL